MVPIDKVLFRKHDGADVCEIQLPDGNVGVFPANELIAGSDPAQNYAEHYKAAFDAYSAGKPQPSELAAQQAAAAVDGTEQSGALGEVESAESEQRSRKATRRNVPASERKPAKKTKAAKKAPAKKAAKKKAAKKAAKSKR